MISYIYCFVCLSKWMSKYVCCLLFIITHLHWTNQYHKTHWLGWGGWPGPARIYPFSIVHFIGNHSQLAVSMNYWSLKRNKVSICQWYLCLICLCLFWIVFILRGFFCWAGLMLHYQNWLILSLRPTSKGKC